jgi:transcriptional regulator of acetoin/glycerol metabolism
MRPDHIETVIAALEESPTRIEAESISHSWRRSAAIHQVDPASPELPHILGVGELREVRESIESVVLAAQPELDRLHNIVAEAGYVTLFCNSTGVAVDHRGKDERAAEFRHCGIWLGGVWSESTEGTNGIGTCIAESRPVTIHQHNTFVRGISA